MPRVDGTSGAWLCIAVACDWWLNLQSGKMQMSLDQGEDERVYCVLVNGEEQYSLWLKDKPVPAGWRAAGFDGSKDACTSYVDNVWTDMRPLSLREKMEGEPA